jgi:hypothetical protein
MVTSGQAADLEAARVRRLASHLATDLKALGYVTEDVERVADVDRWRRAARRAAKDLGIRIRTGVGDVRIWAIDIDRKPTPEEMKRAVDVLDYLDS